MDCADPKVKAALQRLLIPYAESFYQSLASCESPIEQLFLAALLESGAWDLDAGRLDRAYYRGKWPLFRSLPETDWPDARGVFASRSGSPAGHGFVFGQAHVLISEKAHTPRVDFAICVRDAHLVIELDGHEFHERTKEQAKRDKSRDRLLTASGWRVLRFTGSEIWANASRCVEQVEEVIWAVGGPRT